jgi:peroxiredoxin
MKWVLAVAILSLALPMAARASNPINTTPGPEIQEPPNDEGSEGVGGGKAVADLVPGDHAPAFRAASSLGKPIQLSDLKGHASILLFTADPKSLGRFTDEDDSLQTLGVTQYAVCQDSRQNVTDLAKRLNLDFPVLSDPNGDIARSFGMFDLESQEVVPGIVLIDDKGVIRGVVQGPVSPGGVLTLVTEAIRNY